MTLEEALIQSIAFARERKAAEKTLFLVPPPQAPGLPAELYYTGTDLRVPAEPMDPIDETRPLTGMDRDARALAAAGRRRLIRFFAGRWSQRLQRVVRPV
jgi:hypothetical protein